MYIESTPMNNSYICTYISATTVLFVLVKEKILFSYVSIFPFFILFESAFHSKQKCALSETSKCFHHVFHFEFSDSVQKITYFYIFFNRKPKLWFRMF